MPPDDEPTPVARDGMDAWEYLLEPTPDNQTASRAETHQRSTRSPAAMPGFSIFIGEPPMAHNLEIINGKASFAYAGRPGWHGLGQSIPPGMEDSETVSELAGLNRRVVPGPALHHGRWAARRAPGQVRHRL